MGTINDIKWHDGTMARLIENNFKICVRKICLCRKNFVSLHHRYKPSFPVIEEATDSKDDDEERYDECPDVGDT